jgi:hypothetical protein
MEVLVANRELKKSKSGFRKVFNLKRIRMAMMRNMDMVFSKSRLY